MKPYLEISVEHAEDPHFLSTDLLERVKEEITQYCPEIKINSHITKSQSLLFEFESEEDFKTLYNKDYQIYSYLYDEILKNNLIFDSSIFRTHKEKFQKQISKTNEDKNFYLILRYKSNFLEPMRRNYNLVFKVNEILGSNVVNEEIEGGFLRFVKNKEDYEAMSIGNDDYQKWVDFIQKLKIDLSHPTIQKFLEIIKSYLHDDCSDSNII